MCESWDFSQICSQINITPIILCCSNVSSKTLAQLIDTVEEKRISRERALQVSLQVIT